ncbi:DUF499 domain-containing protein [Pseudarthrobacter oxydans]|uniref:DUF499 domain-containing protein n=1 Tax=Pseudarthrobacter oxydans TaxID=1671 RepID=UPI00381ED153
MSPQQTSSHTTKHWADLLELRDEVRATDGSVGELQMSLAKAVYQTVPVPYARCSYYTDITEPTPKLVGFLGRVARRLGVADMDTQACFHLDQGMGGGKSHALVGIWHMIQSPSDFFASDLGQEVLAAAGVGGHPIDLTQVIPVVLTCDGFSPGKTDPRFGPATDLFGRFLWLLFANHPDRMGRWRHYMDMGANKVSLQSAFAEVASPVLILIDELMDYAMALSDESAIGSMPGEQAFLNSLTDAVDDQPNVALVLVMIKSEEDEAGYHPQADALRDYLTPRLQRNGETVTVTEPADFANIIRRRLFARADITEAANQLGLDYAAATDAAWEKQVYAGLGSGRGSVNLQSRISETYPFHPDLFALVSKEWTVVQAFQRVRSTVAIFARTALHWVNEHTAGRWAPALIGVGDIPLHTDALEALLSSGILAANDRAIQGYRAVATTDVINTGGGGGTAFTLDRALAANGVVAGQPAPAVRMATACLTYSLVSRPGGARGATSHELLAAIHDPGVPYTAAEEVFNAMVASSTEGGLGALDRVKPATGRAPIRYYLSIKQTLTMYHAQAMTMFNGEASLDKVWERTKALASKGLFSRLVLLDRPEGSKASLSSVFADLDTQENKLVVLDPRHWTLLNGRDAQTRADLDIAYGVAPGLTNTFASSMVVAVATTQRRDRTKLFARDLLAWERVVAQINREDEEYGDAARSREDASKRLDEVIQGAYQHYGYLLRTGNGLTVQYNTVPDTQTTLNGANVWANLIDKSRAVAGGQLSPTYVAQLIAAGNFGRDLTPKELFAQPYSNPTWPLISSDNEMRHALFSLATSSEWMLVDSDGTEILPSTPEQIQPATLQQTLRRRPSVVSQDNEEPKPDTPRSSFEDDFTQDSPNSDRSGVTPEVLPPATVEPTFDDNPSYEVTTITLPDMSVTDAAKREQVWQFIREMASLLDAAKNRDIQMLGATLTINASTGETAALVAKAQEIPAARARVEADDL